MCICFNALSAYDNDNLSVSLLKINSTKNYSFLEISQILQQNSNFNSNSQSQPSEREIKHICGLGARFGCERVKRAFKPPRLKSQICFISLSEGVSLAAGCADNYYFSTSAAFRRIADTLGSVISSTPDVTGCTFLSIV